MGTNEYIPNIIIIIGMFLLIVWFYSYTPKVLMAYSWLYAQGYLLAGSGNSRGYWG